APAAQRWPGRAAPTRENFRDSADSGGPETPACAQRICGGGPAGAESSGPPAAPRRTVVDPGILIWEASSLRSFGPPSPQLASQAHVLLRSLPIKNFPLC